ncbi:MAG: class I SAM-dependent methyltransferase [Methanosarcinales archaeon]|nr:class I SAM-dependent methyltransferase [Methanosarcinales archaeon]
MPGPERRDFDKDAPTWDQEPKRLKLARDVGSAILQVVGDPSGMDVLDFGCGTGLLTLQLQPRVRSITGADSSRGMLDVLKGKVEGQGLSNMRLLHLDHESREALQGPYHLIVSNMTLHHIPDFRTLLALFFKILAPGGRLCLSDLDPEDGRFHESDVGVFHQGFDREALAGEFARAGFEDVRHLTAAEMIKTDATGQMSRFSIFLITGQKEMK